MPPKPAARPDCTAWQARANERVADDQRAGAGLGGRRAWRDRDPPGRPKAVRGTAPRRPEIFLAASSDSTCACRLVLPLDLGYSYMYV